MVEDRSTDASVTEFVYMGSNDEDVPGPREGTGMSGMRSRNEGRPWYSEGNWSRVEEVAGFRLVRCNRCCRRAYRTRAAAMESMSTNPPTTEQITAMNVRFDVNGLGCELADGSGWLGTTDPLSAKEMGVGRVDIEVLVPMSVIVTSGSREV